MRILSFILFFSSIILLSLSSPFSAAHGYGNTQTVMSGEHRIEFGMTDAPPEVGKRAGLSFSIDDPATNTPVAATQASIRISKGDDIYFISDGFRLTNETALTMSFIFPEPGTYEIDLRAGDDAATFTVDVIGASYNWPLAIAGGILILLFSAWFISRKQ